jgi:hypothetical protein
MGDALVYPVRTAIAVAEYNLMVHHCTRRCTDLHFVPSNTVNCEDHLSYRSSLQNMRSRNAEAMELRTVTPEISEDLRTAGWEDPGQWGDVGGGR